jgi:hypothetical protein
MIKSNGRWRQHVDRRQCILEETNVFKSERDKGAEVKKEREGGFGGGGRGHDQWPLSNPLKCAS